VRRLVRDRSVSIPYDAINTAIFLPHGGSGRLRQSLVDALEVRRGNRVLELGCGTGQVTARLLASGAEVVAVDELPEMLAAARRRAPGATFVAGDAIDADVGGSFDRVVLSFVLHGFAGRGRLALLRRAAAPLTPGGRIGVLEWSLPSGDIRATLWRRFLRALEPDAGNTEEVLDGALDREIREAGLQVENRRPVAGGRAQILVVGPGGTGPSGPGRRGYPRPECRGAPTEKRSS
jgi:ubiquinone/menaquinone biosynthesis C-methylase UbiE